MVIGMFKMLLKQLRVLHELAGYLGGELCHRTKLTN
jgi:hypothetical protein